MRLTTTKNLLAPMRVMHVSGVLASEQRAAEEQVHVDVPCYTNAKRGTAFICPFKLRSGVPAQKWVLRGVCLLVHPEFRGLDE